MNTPGSIPRVRLPALLIPATLLGAVSAAANPISIPPPPFAREISVLTALALLLEITCVVLLLRRWRTPRLFFLWLVAMHGLTYPAFLGVVWLLQDLRPSQAVAAGELLAVMVEGTIIYLLCRFLVIPPREQPLPKPSFSRCWMASLAGNACSFVAFPLLLKAYEWCTAA